MCIGDRAAQSEAPDRPSAWHGSRPEGHERPPEPASDAEWAYGRSGKLEGGKDSSPQKLARGSWWYELREAVALALIVFVGLTLVLQHAVVEGESMLPNFEQGQRLLVNKLALRWRAPARGDVVVFHAPGGLKKDFIKRVVGLPGERVEIRDGLVYVNGQLLEEPWQPIRDHTAFPPYVVPPGQVFVLGDNRPNSNDSRTWGGGLPMQRIVGQVWLCIWPPECFGLVGRPRRLPSHGTETVSSGPGAIHGQPQAPP